MSETVATYTEDAQPRPQMYIIVANMQNKLQGTAGEGVTRTLLPEVVAFLGRVAEEEPDVFGVTEAYPEGQKMAPEVYQLLNRYIPYPVSNKDGDGRPDAHSDVVFIHSRFGISNISGGAGPYAYVETVRCGGRNAAELRLRLGKTTVKGMIIHGFDRFGRISMEPALKGRRISRMERRERSAREARRAQAQEAIAKVLGANGDCAFCGGDLNSIAAEAPQATVLGSEGLRRIVSHLPVADPGEVPAFIASMPTKLRPAATKLWRFIGRPGSLGQRLAAMVERKGGTEGFRQTLREAGFETANPAYPVTKPVTKRRLPFGLNKWLKKFGAPIDDIYVRGMEVLDAGIVQTGTASDHDGVYVKLAVRETVPGRSPLSV